MKNEDNIHKDHRKRMRQKFSEIGFQGWSDYEILEYLLYNVYRQGDTNPTAHRMLQYSANSFVTLFENASDMRMAEDLHNVGENAVLFLRSLDAFIRYYKRRELEEKPVRLSRRNFMEIINIVGFSRENEDLLMICMDSLLNVKTVVNVTEECGTMYASTSIERIVKSATMCSAKNVVLVHNHPDENRLVSDDDKAMTFDVEERLGNVGINLVDHYIVCGDEVLSVRLESFRHEEQDVYIEEDYDFD